MGSVSLKSICKSFGETQVLHDIDIDNDIINGHVTAALTVTISTLIAGKGISDLALNGRRVAFQIIISIKVVVLFRFTVVLLVTARVAQNSKLGHVIDAIRIGGRTAGLALIAVRAHKQSGGIHVRGQ